MSDVTWSDCPDLLEITTAYKSLAAVKGSILRLKRKISKTEDVLKEQFPRKPHMRNMQMTEDLDALTELEVKEIEIELDIKVLNMRFDFYKAYQYRKN